LFEVAALKNQYKISKGRYEINNNKSITMAVLSTAYLFKIRNLTSYQMMVFQLDMRDEIKGSSEAEYLLLIGR